MRIADARAASNVGRPATWFRDGDSLSNRKEAKLGTDPLNLGKDLPTRRRGQGVKQCRTPVAFWIGFARNPTSMSADRPLDVERSPAIGFRSVRTARPSGALRTE